MKYQIYLLSNGGGRSTAHKVDEELFGELKRTIEGCSSREEVNEGVNELLWEYSVHDYDEACELERDWVGDGVSCFVVNNNHDGVYSIDVDTIELRQQPNSNEQHVHRYGEGLWREEKHIFEGYTTWIFTLETKEEGFDPCKLFFKKSDYIEEDLNEYKYIDALSYEDGELELEDCDYSGKYVDRLLAIRGDDTAVIGFDVDELEKVKDLLALPQESSTIISEPSGSSMVANILNKQALITENHETEDRNDELLTCYVEHCNFNDGLAKVRKNGKYGFIDKTGKITVPLEYDDAGNYFVESLVSVKRDGKWGVVDKTGKIIIPIEYDGWIDYGYCLLMKKKSKWSIVNKAEKTIVQVDDFDNLVFREGLALVQNCGLHGFIDMDGKEIVPLEYDEANHFSEGIAVVSEGIVHGTRKWGCIDKTGKFVVPFVLEYDSIGYFKEGLVVVKKDDKCGCIDKTGKLVVPVEYDEVLRSGDSILGVKKNGKWGCVDKTGKFVVPVEYDNFPRFSDGLAWVKKGGKWGCIDSNGNVVVPVELKYDRIGFFSENLTWVKKDGKWGCIDKNGKVAVPLEYDDGYRFFEGLAVVKKDGKWGCIDKNGKVVVPWEEGAAMPVSDKMESFSEESTDDTTDDSEGRIYESICISGFCVEGSVGRLSDVDIDRIKSGAIEGQSSFIKLAQANDSICHDFFFETIDEISIDKVEECCPIKIPFVRQEEDEVEQMEDIYFEDFEEKGIIIKEEAPRIITEGNIVLVNPEKRGYYYWDDDHVDLSKLEITKCVRKYPDGNEIEGFVVKYKGEQAISHSSWQYPEINIQVDGEWNDYAW